MEIEMIRLLALYAVTAMITFLSTSTSAVVVNTLNGVRYEWHELSATKLMTRREVENLLTDPTSSLFGYEYASRSLVESLLLSYSSWDGQHGWHGEESVVKGLEQLVLDFGPTETFTLPNIRDAFTTVDGYNNLQYDSGIKIHAFYGLSGECSDEFSQSCIHSTDVDYANGLATMATQSQYFGWSASYINPSTISIDYDNNYYGSFLVRVIPVPSSIWLFVSGFIFLIANNARKSISKPSI